MYSCNGDVTRFGGTTVCDRLLRPHLHFLGGFLHMKGPLDLGLWPKVIAEAL